ncbi:MAG: flagellar type III secretion system protein FlhB, partial [Succinivibrionaceae bacterium]|nr:flagellar type III secretion system protein FlhB [Succinivibrionaceae bacterium]
MADSDSGEKSEQPTEKRLGDARRRGQLPRSRELSTLAVLLSGVLSLWIFSSFLGGGMERVMLNSFSLSRDEIFTPEEMGRLFIRDLLEILPSLLGITAVVLACGIYGNIAIGGYNFSTEAMQPKFSKLNPLSGIKRIFSLNSLVELVKSVFKIAIIGSVCYLMLSGRAMELLRLSYIESRAAIGQAISDLFFFMLIIVCGMIPIVLMDVPWQKWHYIEQLKMTKQEVKDEFKQTEGSPEIKGRIKRKQMEMAMSRMMAKVPQADVVVTNPTHYAAAIAYDPEGETAPIVVAKG